MMGTSDLSSVSDALEFSLLLLIYFWMQVHLNVVHRLTNLSVSFWALGILITTWNLLLAHLSRGAGRHSSPWGAGSASKVELPLFKFTLGHINRVSQIPMTTPHTSWGSVKDTQVTISLNLLPLFEQSRRLQLQQHSQGHLLPEKKKFRCWRARWLSR